MTKHGSKVPNVFDLANDLECLMIAEEITCNGGSSSRKLKESSLKQHSRPANFQFPPNLMIILKSLRGNSSCIDCGTVSALSWASVKFGTLMCENCAFLHIETGLGDNCTSIRSLAKHSWKLPDILALLEGGNAQFASFVGVKNTTAVKSSSLENSTFTLIRPKGGLRPTLFTSIRMVTGVVPKPETSSLGASTFDLKYKGKLAKDYEKVLIQRVAEVTAVHCRGRNDFGLIRDGLNTVNYDAGEEPFNDEMNFKTGSHSRSNTDNNPRGIFMLRRSSSSMEEISSELTTIALGQKEKGKGLPLTKLNRRSTEPVHEKRPRPQLSRNVSIATAALPQLSRKPIRDNQALDDDDVSSMSSTNSYQNPPQETHGFIINAAASLRNLSDSFAGKKIPQGSLT